MKNNLINLVSVLEKINNFKYINHIEKISEIIINKLKKGGTIYLAGNGGSAAQCQHFAAELVGKFKKVRKSINAVSLTTDTSIITSIANDINFDHIFLRQVNNKLSKKDVVICFSTSGKSKNILNLLKYTAKNNFFSILISGKSGGFCNKYCSHIIKVPSQDTAVIQEAHMVITHYLCEKIERYL